ncbi:hypothetical protein VNO77_24715 [Canavalia gladiata]|uniref:Kinetochore protein SPC25 n=1 Tax=Canavalia gladiata TaxID=3824 RepID=A0AAN9L6U6_CANGL
MMHIQNPQTQDSDWERKRMESPVSNCDREIPLHMQNIDAFTVSHAKSLETLRATVQQAAQYQVQLEEVKGKLREAEDDLVKALAVKTRKEVKRMVLMDLIASAKARVEDLNKIIQEQRTKKQEYATFLSQQSLACEGKLNESIEPKDETQEATSWYNRVLGFHVKGGRVLSCEPFLDGTKELIHELNKTNGLFKFVRVMRKRTEPAGSSVVRIGEHEESAFNSASAPVVSMSSVISDSPTKENEHRVEPTESNSQSKKQNVRRRVKSAVLSPGSASSVRQSSRLKERGHTYELDCLLFYVLVRQEVNSKCPGSLKCSGRHNSRLRVLSANKLTLLQTLLAF